MRDPLIGTVLGERYRIISRLGIGGMGAVYRAEHMTLKRDVAVKVLLPDISGKDEFIRRFHREAESASRLSHLNIIAVNDFGRSADGLLFLVMEFLDGDALTSVIRQGPVALPRALAIFKQMLDGLEHAHAAGIVHRDLKPDNIMLVEREGRVDVAKILDFGIAKVTDAENNREALTQAGVIFGTPEYLSPEQALGDVVDARADLYAAGVILFEMLTGRRPFESDDKVKIVSMHLCHPVPAVHTVNPDVVIPMPIADLVMQALEKPRENRFLSAGAFREALADAVLASQTSSIPAARERGNAFWAESRSGTAAAGSTTTTTTTTAAAAAVAGFAAGSKNDGSELTAIPIRTFLGSGSLGARRRRWGLGAGGLALALMAILFFFAPRRSDHDRAATVATSRVPSVTPSTPELAAQLQLAEAWLASAEIGKARLVLEDLLARHPREARVRYLLGRVAFAEDRLAQAFDDYRQAIAIDPGFRGDPVLVEHLGLALLDAKADGKTADSAMDLAIERVGRPAVNLLERVANGSGDVRRRQRAAQALDELGEGKRVDRIGLQMAQFKRAGTCEERKPLAVALGNSGDVRALTVLRGVRPRSGLGGMFSQPPDSSCMKAELEDAIHKLEDRLPPAKKPASRQANHKSGSRSSFMRGR
jgi:tetratricopeptide (TPR) repeat protein